MRLSNGWVAAQLKAAWRHLRSVVGSDELLIAAGLWLLTTGLWPLVDRAALIAPGAVLLWIALPQRTSFIDRDSRSKGGA